MPGAAVNLQDFIVKDLPPEVYYVPNYVSEDCERNLLSQIYAVSPSKWTQLSHRKLQNWGGTPHIKGMVEEKLPFWLSEQCTKLTELGLYDGAIPNHVLINEYLPGQGIMPHTDGPLYFPTVAIISLSSNVLIDFYKPYNHINNDNNHNDNYNDNKHNNDNNNDNGNVGEDTSGNSSQKLTDRRIGSLYLERRSLVIFRSDAYSNYLHGIQDTTNDHIDDKVLNLASDLNGMDLKRVETRVSMTIRVVPKTIKASKIFGKVK